jgi:predicted permease
MTPDTTLTVLNAVVPVFGLAVVGFGVRKLNWLTEEADQSWMRVNINLLLPALILDSTLGNSALRQIHTVILAPVLGYLLAAAGIWLAFSGARFAGLRDAKAARTFGVTVGLQNYGYVPIPLALLLFGQETVGVVCMFVVGVEAALWTVGLAVMTGAGIGRDWRNVVNAPLIAIVVALLLNWMNAPAHIPQPVSTPVSTLVHWLAQCAVPSALLLIGAIVADHLHEFHSPRAVRVIVAAVVLRLGLLPWLFLLAAKFLPLSVELRRVLVIEAAMVSAVFPIAMAKHYGGDPPTALRAVLSTSLVGFLTIPLWIRFGLTFVGL